MCDFFSQPAVPISEDYYPRFVEAVISDLSEPETHVQRYDLLLDVYRIKWCCILLNEFLPAAAGLPVWLGMKPNGGWNNSRTPAMPWRP